MKATKAFADVIGAYIEKEKQADELRQRYGERTFDRLRAITTTVCFSGPSLRK